ncbi:MAG TPA: transcriptional regulator [Acidimicrobiaceae bacterium]|nr:transcriptional regulator [Acidimicrobiaceae bacterium]
MPADKTFEVSRSTVIRAEPASILEQINDLRNWTRWSPWEGIDPQLTRTYTGPSSGPGSSYAWQGNRKVGAGKMTITQSSPERVVIDLEFLKPFKAKNVTTIDLTPADDETRVDWTMTGPKTLISTIMGVFMSMDKMVGGDFERGLSQLKSLVE